MRYRDLCQGIFSLRRPGRSELRYEGAPMLGDAVHGEEQFVHARDEGDLGQLAARTQAFVVRPQPWVVAHRAEGRHPQCSTQGRIADRGQRRAGRLTFAGVAQARDGAHRLARLIGGTGGDDIEGPA